MIELKNRTLLVVDDEADLRSPLVEEFTSLGYTVLEACSGNDAFKIIETTKVDLVISDIRMANGDGITLLKNVKKLNCAFPVVLLVTGHADLTKDHAYNLGAESLLAKPFNIDEICSAVETLLTPHGVRWSAAGVKPTDLSFEREFSSFSNALAEKLIAFGRGGMLINNETLPIGRRIKFEIKFSTGTLSLLSGVGIVRWARRDPIDSLPVGSGIEFESLDENSRRFIIDLSKEMQLQAFIPNANS